MPLVYSNWRNKKNFSKWLSQIDHCILFFFFFFFLFLNIRPLYSDHFNFNIKNLFAKLFGNINVVMFVINATILVYSRVGATRSTWLATRISVIVYLFTTEPSASGPPHEEISLKKKKKKFMKKWCPLINYYTSEDSQFYTD